MSIDDRLRGLGKTLGEPEIDTETARVRVRAIVRQLQDDPLEARRIDNLAKLADRGEEDLRLGQEALQQRNFGAAVRHLRRAARDGSDEAAYQLGLLLEMRSIRQRLKGRLDKAGELADEARQWRLRAQESGIAEALDDSRADDIQPPPVTSQPGAAREPALEADREPALEADRRAGRWETRNEAGAPPGQPPGGKDDCCVVGIELLPYRFTAVLVNGYGEIVGERTVKLSDMEPGAVIAVLAATAREMVDTVGPGPHATRVALGVQLGAPVSAGTGTVHFYAKQPPKAPKGMAEFKWHDVALGRRLQEETGYQTVVLNDAVAFAERERWFGVGRETDDFAVMLIREGVGGAIVKHGQHFDGPVEIGNFLYTSADLEQDLELGDAQRGGVLEYACGTTGIVNSASKYAGQAFADIEAAADAASQDGPLRVASAAFLEAGLAVRAAISYLVQFAGPSHVVLCAPEALLRSKRRASRAFLSQLKSVRETVVHEALRGFDLVTRVTGPTDGAHGAALAALTHCFDVVPAAPRASTRAARLPITACGSRQPDGVA